MYDSHQDGGFKQQTQTVWYGMAWHRIAWFRDSSPQRMVQPRPTLLDSRGSAELVDLKAHDPWLCPIADYAKLPEGAGNEHKSII